MQPAHAGEKDAGPCAAAAWHSYPPVMTLPGSAVCGPGAITVGAKEFGPMGLIVVVAAGGSPLSVGEGTARELDAVVAVLDDGVDGCCLLFVEHPVKAPAVIARPAIKPAER